jgi:hypothetical protein
VELTLSMCFPDKYTCDSGHCVHLRYPLIFRAANKDSQFKVVLSHSCSSKCDTQIDCEDKSDEPNCDYKNYAKELVPRDSFRKTAIVYINISILAIPKIETFNLKFTPDFFLNLRCVFIVINSFQCVSYLNSQVV